MASASEHASDLEASLEDALLKARRVRVFTLEERGPMTPDRARTARQMLRDLRTAMNGASASAADLRLVLKSIGAEEVPGA
jgi:hypothetical protein